MFKKTFTASISYIGKLFGSLSSGVVSESFGRKNSMLLINIPHLMAFLLFYFSTSIWNVFVAVTLLGFGSGFLKAPSMCFVAEIRQVWMWFLYSLFMVSTEGIIKLFRVFKKKIEFFEIISSFWIYLKFFEVFEVFEFIQSFLKFLKCLNIFDFLLKFLNFLENFEFYWNNWPFLKYSKFSNNFNFVFVFFSSNFQFPKYFFQYNFRCLLPTNSEVSIRGILISMTTIGLTVGPLVIFSLGALTAWREIALYCCIIQIFTTILLAFVSIKKSSSKLLIFFKISNILNQVNELLLKIFDSTRPKVRFQSY